MALGAPWDALGPLETAPGQPKPLSGAFKALRMPPRVLPGLPKSIFHPFSSDFTSKKRTAFRASRLKISHKPATPQACKSSGFCLEYFRNLDCSPIFDCVHSHSAAVCAKHIEFPESKLPSFQASTPPCLPNPQSSNLVQRNARSDGRKLTWLAHAVNVIDWAGPCSKCN